MGAGAGRERGHVMARPGLGGVLTLGLPTRPRSTPWQPSCTGKLTWRVFIILNRRGHLVHGTLSELNQLETGSNRGSLAFPTTLRIWYDPAWWSQPRPGQGAGAISAAGTSPAPSPATREARPQISPGQAVAPPPWRVLERTCRLRSGFGRIRERLINSQNTK